ncbi:MAG: hypothetical protein CMJ69_21235 [Planctomycetaceae bacterium]|nr:hypothetical protein [Planctomycetaceae bacterium]
MAHLEKSNRRTQPKSLETPTVSLSPLHALLLAALVIDVTAGRLAAAEKPPTSRDSRLVIELFSADPDIVTPTGLDVDHLGRVFAIESNTHFPPEGYDRHPTDRLLVLRDRDGDGRAEKPTVFADGFVHAMSVAVRTSFEPGQPDTVLVATRKEVLALWDDDGDLVADRRRRILHLDTPGNYPHNGLAGFAFDGRGHMFIGLGENLGANYKLIGSDGTTLAGGGEGGNIYRCRPDGSELKGFATGFWNPHASCVDTFGRLFSVDNDPDSLPPCRLMHIVAGGDYGYRYRNGRKGFHPFTSWNGEIPGTLPMMAGTGEAPSGMVSYESIDLPDEYRGDLLVTSWGDHRIDRFRMVERGASFESVAEPLIQGGVNFRPVGLATAPDGSLYCTDWVLRDYKVHGRGRVWRIRRKPGRKAESSRPVIDVATVTPKRGVDELTDLVGSAHLPLRRAAAVALSGTDAGRRRLGELISDPRTSSRSRIEVLWAIASVDPETTDYGFLRPGGRRTRLGGGSTEVEIAVIELIGSPQFPFDASKRDFLRDEQVAALLWVPDPLDRPVATPGHRARWAAASMRLLSLEAALGLLVPDDPFLMAAVLERVVRRDVAEADLLKAVRVALDRAAGDNGRRRAIRTLLALAVRKRFHDPALARRMLSGGPFDPVVRRLVVQWVAETGRKELRPEVAAILDNPDITADLFRTTLAALDMLDGGDPKKIDKTAPADYVLPLLTDTGRPPAVRSLALQLVDPSSASLDRKLFADLLASSDKKLVAEAVRTLGLSSHTFASELLLGVAGDSKRLLSERADAVAGLGRFSRSPEVAERLRQWVADPRSPLKSEALRSLQPTLSTDAGSRSVVAKLIATVTTAGKPTASDRDLADRLATSLGVAGEKIPGALKLMAAHRPDDLRGWTRLLARGGDAAAGRRLFFHNAGPQCARCHMANGRGRRVGPDLSLIARSRNRRQLLESILVPSREVAPQFTSWTLVTTDGRVLNGVIVYENRDRLTIEDATGKQTNLANTEVELRTPRKTSLMPEKLIERMSISEVRDLLAYLESLK